MTARLRPPRFDYALDSIAGVMGLAIWFALLEIGAFESLQPEIDLSMRFMMALNPGRELSLQPGQPDLYPDV